MGGAAATTGVCGVGAFRTPCDGTASAERGGATGTSVGNAAVECSVGTAAAGGLAGAAVASASGTLVWVGVASADEASLGEEVEPTRLSTELRTFLDVERDEEPAVEVDESVDGVGPVDDGLSADSDDELEADDDDDDEPDDELEGPADELELESVVSANATAGVFATAAPTPSATANTPTRATYCDFTGPALGGKLARAPVGCPLEPP